MQGKPTLHYFHLYGRAEMIRMTLYKAGVEFEDNRVTGQAWADLKASGKLESGQVPQLDLADGTKLTQSVAITNYLGATYKLKPEDPMLCYVGEKCVALTMDDFLMKHWMKAHFQPEEPRAAAIKEVIDTHMPVWLAALEKALPSTKLLCGDTSTIYDFQLGGAFVNVICNPNSKDAALWGPAMEKAGPKVQAYVAAFKEDMKEYLAQRPQDCTF